MTDSHAQLLARRRLLTGALMLAIALPAIAPLRARAAAAFDGSWAGADADGETVQAIFAHGEIIGFYWRGDYVEPRDAKLAADGASLSFSFAGGQATATRSAGGMRIDIHDKRGVSRVELRRD